MNPEPLKDKQHVAWFKDIPVHKDSDIKSACDWLKETIGGYNDYDDFYDSLCEMIEEAFKDVYR